MRPGICARAAAAAGVETVAAGGEGPATCTGPGAAFHLTDGPWLRRFGAAFSFPPFMYSRRTPSSCSLPLARGRWRSAHVWAALGLLLAGWVAPAMAQEAKAAAVKPPARPAQAHFRVMWIYDPSEKAMVSWTTPVAGSAHAVYYDTRPRQGRLTEYAHRMEALPSRQYVMRPDDKDTPIGWAQNVFLERLQPATTYYFVVVSDRTVSREFHFITAPADDRPVKLIYGGDSRRPPNLPEPHLARRAVNRLIASLVEEQPDILALAHGGDYCSRAQWMFLSDWLSDHELTITTTGRILPIIPARGNHEGLDGFEEVFHWPNQKTSYYYTTAISGRAVLLTLNTQLSRAGDQRDWLEAELALQRQVPGKWIVLQYHIPAYPSVKAFERGAQQREHWVPLFEKFQVDLVCEADDHMLKRTVPIFQDKHDPLRGIVYIGDGGLGVPQRVPDLTRWYLKSPGFATPAHHVHVLEFAEDELRVTAVGLEQELLDQFAVKSKFAPAAAASQ
jgi:acid phosphatase type 7